jgi:hypothetical protein
LLEPSPNGNGDDNGHSVTAEGDEDLLAVVPAQTADLDTEPQPEAADEDTEADEDAEADDGN